jgi:hypothetical protein
MRWLCEVQVCKEKRKRTVKTIKRPTAGKNKMKINVLKNIQGISKMRELILRRSRAC